jgi:peptidoglycan/xylan/chitin deacetylase (PgdA/CDA1 family)
MDRRDFLKAAALASASTAFRVSGFAAGSQPEIAITMDDMSMRATGLLTAEERADRILSALKMEHDLRAAVFSVGRNVETEQGGAVLRRFDRAGHFLANHSYSHPNYHSQSMTLEKFASDMWKGHEVLAGKKLRNFHPFFRFPMLHEGNTVEKRDGMRAFLHEKNYRNGHVTVDTSDWYITQRMDERLAKEPKADLKPYRDYYIAHMTDRAKAYREVALKVAGRQIKHTLLLHFNSTTAHFLGGLIAALKKDGWKLIDAGDAYSDDIFHNEPKTLPAGDSLVRAMAIETGKIADPRYPAEDGSYLEAEMNRLKL